MGNANNGNVFDTSKIERRAYTPFQEKEYVIELDTAKVREASTGTFQVNVVFRIRGERYDNLTVFETLNVTLDAFAMSVNRMTDMGLDVPVIKGSSAKNVAEKIAEFLSGHKGAMIKARVYETQNFQETGYVRNVRGFLGAAS